jgi:hypothetical protein
MSANHSPAAILAAAWAADSAAFAEALMLSGRGGSGDWMTGVKLLGAGDDGRIVGVCSVVTGVVPTDFERALKWWMSTAMSIASRIARMIREALDIIH